MKKSLLNSDLPPLENLEKLINWIQENSILLNTHLCDGYYIDDLISDLKELHRQMDL